MARDRHAPLAPGVPEKRRGLFGRSPISPTGNQAFAIERPEFTPKVSSAALRQIGDEDRPLRRKRRTKAQQDRAWQEKCYEAPNYIAELGYLLELQANVLALCDFPVRHWDEDSGRWKANDRDDETVEFDERPEAVMEAFEGPHGGRPELIRKGGYHLFCAGECTLTGTSVDTGSGIMWEFLSVMELYPDADGTLIRRESGMTSEDVKTLGDDTYVARCLRSSPVYSALAHSEVRRVLPIVEEIKSLTQMVDATVKSRIPANLLFIPEGMTLHGVGDTDDAESLASTGEQGVLYDIDELVDEIYEHVNQSQLDPLSAARLVPLVVVGDGDQGVNIRVIELSRELDGWAQELRSESLTRLARGLDSPPELMSGRASVNHWTSAIIDQDFLVKHIQPIGRLLADFITTSYLRPMLEEFEGMSKEEAYQWKVDFDPSPVTARADEAKSARDLKELLSDEAIISANGFDKADAISPEGRAERRVWQLIESNPTVFAPLLLQLPGFDQYELTDILEMIAQMALAPPAPPAVGGGNQSEPEDADDDDEIVDAESGAETPERPENLSALTQALVAEADMAVENAFRKVGSRFVSHLQGADDGLKARLKTIPKNAMMSAVSRDELSTMGLTPQRLMRGRDDMWRDLHDASFALTSGYLTQDGMDPARASEAATFVAQFLCESMNEFVLDHFHDPARRGANGHRVPTSTVMAILEQALPITV